MDKKQNPLRPHFILSSAAQPERYQPIKKKITGKELPDQDRAIHGQSLLSQLTSIKAIADQTKEQQTQLGMTTGLGLQIVFTSLPDLI